MRTYYCRTWVRTSLNGWVSEIERFDTEQDAIEYGERHVRLIRLDELERDFEVMHD